jgi:hypothetical protein
MKHSPVIVDTPRRCGCRKEIELLIAHAKSDRIFFRVEQLNALAILVLKTPFASLQTIISPSITIHAPAAARVRGS